VLAEPDAVALLPEELAAANPADTRIDDEPGEAGALARLCGLVPCTFLGKHLRFSRTNLDQILTDAARPATTSPRAASGTGAAPRRRGRPPAHARMDLRRPDPAKRTHSSGT
jgi:hypothetical protein